MSKIIKVYAVNNHNEPICYLLYRPEFGIYFFDLWKSVYVESEKQGDKLANKTKCDYEKSGPIKMYKYNFLAEKDQYNFPGGVA